MRLLPCIVLFGLLQFHYAGKAQRLLRLNYQKFGFHHKHDFHYGETFIYKQTASTIWRKDKIMNFRDSMIYFDKDYGLKFNQVRKIKLYTHSYHNKLFQRLFIYAGILYPTLYIANSLILDFHPSTEQKQQVLLITASFFTATFLIRQIGIKRIKLNDNNNLKILELDFEHLNTP